MMNNNFPEGTLSHGTDNKTALWCTAGSLTGLPLAFVNVCHRRVWLACLLE
ncbi:hypothetical protein Asd1617_01986 [Shigella dysenteriae 1617]|uniref:Uncharacterized protein n=1 Tax=Shigella dysenteriae 1617 TaxID=754093 RepID=A0A0A6ZRX8_SHIDY|nr:hypothetical protein Asd1617_01986 [Shigella dysenteriae 1617]